MKQYSIKLYEVWKYVLWFILIQAATSLFLVHIEVIEIKNNESVIGYIIYNDVILVFSYFMIGTIISVYLGAFLSSNYSHKELLQKDIFKFEYKFLQLLTDLLLRLLITLSALSIRLKDVQELSSQEKMQLVGIIFFLVFILIAIFKSAAKSIGVQFLSLIDWIGFALLMPIHFYKNQKEDILSSELPEKTQKIFLKLYLLLSTLMFCAIIYAIVSVFAMVFSEYF